MLTNNQISYLPYDDYAQSANTLFHFMKKQEYLNSILRRRAIIPRFPGKPDIVLPKYKAVVFVNGCFWHGHTDCRYFVWPKNNSEFWREKIIGNIARDQKNYELLRDLGWNVFVIWECELKRSVIEKTLDSLINDIKQGLQSATNL
mgnify:CR=1 FL=1